MQKIGILDFLVPACTITTIVICSIGIFVFPDAFLVFCLTFLIWFLVTTTNHMLQYSLSVQRIVSCIQSTSVPLDFKKYHVLVIPNYNESLSILRKTLHSLAVHNTASSRYIVTLAMEASEKGSFEKALLLQTTFASKFHQIIITIHPTCIPGEARGKASNGIF